MDFKVRLPRSCHVSGVLGTLIERRSAPVAAAPICAARSVCSATRRRRLLPRRLIRVVRLGSARSTGVHRPMVRGDRPRLTTSGQCRMSPVVPVTFTHGMADGHVCGICLRENPATVTINPTRATAALATTPTRNGPPRRRSVACTGPERRLHRRRSCRIGTTSTTARRTQGHPPARTSKSPLPMHGLASARSMESRSTTATGQSLSVDQATSGRYGDTTPELGLCSSTRSAGQSSARSWHQMTRTTASAAGADITASTHRQSATAGLFPSGR